jgi:hypothetical protein
LPDNGDLGGSPVSNGAAATDICGSRAGRTSPVLPVLSGGDQVTAFGARSGRWFFFNRNCVYRNRADYVKTAFGERADTLAISAKA